MEDKDFEEKSFCWNSANNFFQTYEYVICINKWELLCVFLPRC